jgi:hypothetical protein
VLKLTAIGGPSAILEYAGLRWLTDPAFSPPGEYPGGLVKTTPPALLPEQVEPLTWCSSLTTSTAITERLLIPTPGNPVSVPARHRG